MKDKFLGNKFGLLTVIEKTKQRASDKKTIYRCKCDCGNECYKDSGELRVKNPHCGCLTNIIGKKFGSIIVLEKTDSRIRQNVVYKCQCRCGNECFLSRKIITSKYKNKHFPHCGCLNYYKQKPEQWIWSEIIQRCYNPKHKRYYNYGGRGITLYEPWRKDFLEFYWWLFENIGLKPGKGHEYSLDRINNNGNYEPGNLRWATPTEQVRNSRIILFTEKQISDMKKEMNSYITLNNLSRCQAAYEVAKKFNLNRSTVENIVYERCWKDIEPKIIK